MSITQSIVQARSNIIAYLQANLVPMLIGSPGTGKSAIIHEIAKQFDLKVIDLRLSQCDPTDLMGFPRVVDGKASYAPMDTFPIVGDTLPIKTPAIPAVPKGTVLPNGTIVVQDIPEVPATYYAGWLLFLDEFNSAPRSVQAAAYKLVLDRMVGQFKLHSNVKTVCAGNLMDDGAIVEELSTALQSRLVHLQLEITAQEWLDYANISNYDFRIMAFIRNNEDKLYTFKPDHSDHTYACPRTWEFANRLLKVTDINSPNAVTLFSGVLGDGVAAQFVQYSRMASNIPTLAQIELDPKGIPVPNDPSVLFLVSSMLSQAMTETNADAIYTYTMRLPAEFQVVTLRNAIKREFKLFTQPSVQKWVNTDGKQYFMN